jgi:hypothetical protein
MHTMQTTNNSHELARDFMSRTLTVVTQALRTPEGAGSYRHIRAHFPPDYVAALPLPQLHGERAVALVDGMVSQREADPQRLQAAYEEHRRTRVHEGIHIDQRMWYGITSWLFTQMTQFLVFCAAYESVRGDTSLEPHPDDWLGLIIQVRGSKRWTIWPVGDAEPEEILLEAGDVLIMPRGMRHVVSTPDKSVHFVFAFHPHKPIEELRT